MEPVAFSYVRFSSKVQERGDSIRRQMRLAKEWSERSGIPLDTSLKIDDGISAFEGLNADIGALGEFLRLVKEGAVPKGSFLVVESLDRLTRDDVDEALPLLLGMTNAGMRIVQLQPVEVVYQKPVDPTKLIIMVMELMRGNGESQMKRARVGAAWAEKRKLRLEGKAQKPTKTMGDGAMVLTRNLPAWIRFEAGKPVLIPEKAAVVRRIFDLAISGHGTAAITRKLIREGTPPFGRKKKWCKAVVQYVLTARSVLGEFQLHTRMDGDRKPGEKRRRHVRIPVADPIPDYFPPVVSADTFREAAEAMRSRRLKAGRPARVFNPFSGLLKNAARGDSFIIKTRTDMKGRQTPVLLNAEYDQGRAACVTFPFYSFRNALMACLRAVEIGDVIGSPKEGAAALERMEDDLKAVRADLAELRARLRSRVSPTLMDLVEEKEARQAELEASIADASRKQAGPMAHALSEFKSAAEAFEEADSEDARARLRASLRRCIDSVWIVTTNRGMKRYALVQVIFSNGKPSRHALIYNKAPRFNGKRIVPGRWWASSFTADVLTEPADLRDPDFAKDAVNFLPDVADEAVEEFFELREGADEEERARMDRARPWGDFMPLEVK